MRRIALIGAAIAALATLAALFVRLQPAGEARVIRSGSALRVVKSRAGIAIPFGDPCFAKQVVGGRLVADQSFDLPDAGGESINFRVRFDYVPPANLPPGWAEGAWCGVLDRRVSSSLSDWLSTAPIVELRSDPRAAGERAAEHLRAHLSAGGLETHLLTVRPTIPQSALATLPVPAIVSTATKQPPVIFIGLDGADWQLLDRYITAGAMPNLARLVREGSSGVLESEHPPLSPLLWTSMMTGESPLEHEILDFARFNPVSGAPEPITSTERKVPAIWNMATAGGKSVAVFGLWATWPAEPVRGVLVSDRLFGFLFSESERPPHLVYPVQRESWARKILASSEKAIAFEDVSKFITPLTAAEFETVGRGRDPYAHPVSALRRILIETAVYDRLARETLASSTPDLTILYLQGTDSVGHVFAPYAPPRQPQISEADFARYSRVPELYFREVDRLLGDYVTLARERGARLMLASDHGFHWFEGRPTQLSSIAAATAAKWHRKDGMYLLWGAGIRPSSRRTGSAPRISQVCATLLSLLGLPPAKGIAAPALVDVAPALEPAAGDYRAHYHRREEVAAMTRAAASDELAKLKALGYIGSAESATRPAGAGRSTQTAGSFNNRGLILKDRGRTSESIAAFEKALEIDSNLPSALWNLSDLLFADRRNADRSDELLVRAAGNGLPEANKFVIGRAIGYQRSGSAGRSLRLIDAAVKTKPADPELRMFRGRYRLELRDCDGALADFREAQGLMPGNPVTYASAGVALSCLGRDEEAAESYRQSLAIDPDQPRLRQLLAR
ncbi:MAG: alkaline phosphatase family protein [Thermoanaerobaculia bacterium]|nr:alkaline phosphatase family protein [Thermoanaerobaculia bacterium]